MKNLRYFPFMRNRYYEGKLLTAEDFRQEQQYMNDKRRLHNRYFHGAGVVSGLEVIRVDDYSISLEKGMAVDGAGREIVVEEPSIFKLSMLDGFEKAAGADGGESLKLYIAYAEEEVEPVHNMTDQSVHTVEEPDYNKIREGYRLYATDEEPELLEPLDGVGDRLSFLSARGERLADTAGAAGICLARVELVKAGEFYMIEKIQPMYGEQYAGCVPCLEGRIGLLEERLSKVLEQKDGKDSRPVRAAGKDAGDTGDTGGDAVGDAGSGAATGKGTGLLLDPPKEIWQLARGSVKIPLPRHARRDQTAFSQEIAHGLGLGSVDIFLQVMSGDTVYGGAEDVFGDPEAPAACAYRLNRGTGTFVIGIRLLEETEEKELAVNWTALRNRRREEIKKGEKRVYIDPSVANLKVRQEQKFHAVCVNMETDGLVWSVAGPECGEVDGDGLYRAPCRPGVYEITVSHKEEADVRASVFAVVREE